MRGKSQRYFLTSQALKYTARIYNFFHREFLPYLQPLFSIVSLLRQFDAESSRSLSPCFAVRDKSSGGLKRARRSGSLRSIYPVNLAGIKPCGVESGLYLLHLFPGRQRGSQAKDQCRRYHVNQPASLRVFDSRYQHPRVPAPAGYLVSYDPRISGMRLDRAAAAVGNGDVADQAGLRVAQN